jgi:hypothetical protein
MTLIGETFAQLGGKINVHDRGGAISSVHAEVGGKFNQRPSRFRSG